MPYMVTFTINIPPMLAYILYMEHLGYVITYIYIWLYLIDLSHYYVFFTEVLKVVDNPPC